MGMNNWHFWADNDDNNIPLGQNFGQILVIIGEFDNFAQIFKFLNVISDQFMDCNAIIDHYTHIAVHKLDWNCV